MENNEQKVSRIKIENAKEILKKKAELIKSARELTKYRKEQSLILKENIMSTLKDLCLPNVQFDIIFLDNNLDNDSNFKENGVDLIDFVVSFNYGEDLKSLSKVASGGEMSRVMLAFKTHLLKNAKLSTIIFDEIDTGISGEVAKSLADKIKEISNTTQVLSISHLPIVAANADNHLFVYKMIENDREWSKMILNDFEWLWMIVNNRE